MLYVNQMLLKYKPKSLIFLDFKNLAWSAKLELQGPIGSIGSSEHQSCIIIQSF